MFSLSARRLWPCLVVAAALPLAAAQKSVVIPLLPAPVWKLEATTPLSLQSLAQFGSHVPVDKELGVTSASRRVYQMRNFQVAAIFEKASDPSSAFSLYTLYGKEDMRPVKGIELAVANGALALMTRGRYFIRVLRPVNPVLPDQNLKSLLVTIGGARLSVENADSLPTALPRRALVPGTEKYILGPKGAKLVFPSFPAALIGFADGVEAKAGTYRAGGEKMILFQISYPTPQLAQARFQEMDNALHINQLGGPGSIYGRQDGSYVLLALDAKSHDAATHFLDRFRINQVVSTVPQIPHKENVVIEVVQLFIANGELVGLILLFAILGGTLIYLTKRLIMKLFPKSRWIRPDDEIVIRLRLS